MTPLTIFLALFAPILVMGVCTGQFVRPTRLISDVLKSDFDGLTRGKQIYPAIAFLGLFLLLINLTLF